MKKVTIKAVYEVILNQEMDDDEITSFLNDEIPDMLPVGMDTAFLQGYEIIEKD